MSPSCDVCAHACDVCAHASVGESRDKSCLLQKLALITARGRERKGERNGEREREGRREREGEREREKKK